MKNAIFYSILLLVTSSLSGGTPAGGGSGSGIIIKKTDRSATLSSNEILLPLEYVGHAGEKEIDKVKGINYDLLKLADRNKVWMVVNGKRVKAKDVHMHDNGSICIKTEKDQDFIVVPETFDAAALSQSQQLSE